MDCYRCKTELIWGGDTDLSLADEYGEFDMVTNLSCPECGVYVEVYTPRDE